MDGRVLKSRIVMTGAKLWEVAREANMTATRLSQIVNNHIDPTHNEVCSIEAAITRLSRQQAGRAAGGVG